MRFKRIIALLLATTLVGTAYMVTASAEDSDQTMTSASTEGNAPTYTVDPASPIMAQAYILIEAHTGKILRERGAHQRIYPASMVKTLTALLLM